MKPAELTANITAQLYSVTTKKDGGGRIQFEFGMESLNAIHKIQKWNAAGGVNFTVVCVPTDLMEQLCADDCKKLHEYDADKNDLVHVEE